MTVPRQERRKLSNDEISRELEGLDGCESADGKLHWELEFENFVEAFAFMTKLA